MKYKKAYTKTKNYYLSCLKINIYLTCLFEKNDDEFNGKVSLSGSLYSRTASSLVYAMLCNCPYFLSLFNFGPPTKVKTSIMFERLLC